METIFEKMHKLLQEGNDLEFISVCESSGSTPRKAGANMIVLKDGAFFGTIGGGSLEFDSINIGIKLLEQQKSSIQHYALNNYEAANIGMVCGGDTTLCFAYIDHKNENVKIALQKYLEIKKIHQACYLKIIINNNNNKLTDFIILDGELRKCNFNTVDSIHTYEQPISSFSKVYIFGGGHISRCLVPLLQSVFFDCVVVESDEKFIKDENYPTLKEKIICPFECVDEHIRFSNNDYVVIVTRGHLHDATVLAKVLKNNLTYIGMIGSKTKIRATYEKLSEEYHYTNDDFEKVYAPIGLKIGGETPEEIAVSIAAEMIKVRHNKEKGK